MICYICGLMSNPIGDYVESNRLMLYREIDGLSGDRTEVIGNIIWGVDVYTDHLFAYRYDGGYRVVSAYINRKAGSHALPRMFYQLALKLKYLNEDKGIDVVFGYMDLYCKEYVDRDGFEFSREKLYDMVESAYNVDVRLAEIVELRKYRWVGKFALMPMKLKQSIIMTHNNKTKTEENIRAIEAALEMLKDTDMFITKETLAQESKLSFDVVTRYVSIYRDDINTHNLTVAGTDNFKQYVRDQNISRIVDAIEATQGLQDKLSKTDLADELELSRMTIHRLWKDQRIQTAMLQYNGFEINTKER